MTERYTQLWDKVSRALHELCLESKRIGESPSTMLQNKLMRMDMEISKTDAAKVLEGILFMNTANTASAQIVKSMSVRLKQAFTEEDVDGLVEDLISGCEEQFQAQAADIYVCAVAGEWKKFEERLLDLSEKDTITFAELVKVFWSNI